MPLLLAAVPLAVGSMVPFVAPDQTTPAAAAAAFEQELAPVENFDPEARARLLVTELPRQWTGSYQAFQNLASVPVTLQISSLTPDGQMIDLRGQITIAGVTAPVQGNLNAKSDQLDLLLLGSTMPPGLESGGEFLGLQGLSLFAWNAPRLTSPGGAWNCILPAPPPGRLPSRWPPEVRGGW